VNDAWRTRLLNVPRARGRRWSAGLCPSSHAGESRLIVCERMTLLLLLTSQAEQEGCTTHPLCRGQADLQVLHVLLATFSLHASASNDESLRVLGAIRMKTVIEDVTNIDPTENDETLGRILNQVRLPWGLATRLGLPNDLRSSVECYLAAAQALESSDQPPKCQTHALF
jgi:hypothetical protein